MYGSSRYTLVRIYDAPGCTNLIKSIVSKDKLLDREPFGSPAICTEGSLAVLQFSHFPRFRTAEYPQPPVCRSRSTHCPGYICMRFVGFSSAQF